MWIESTINDLYNNTVKAFPKTTKRQHATHTIKIEHIDWIPFLGLKTLFVKGLARNEGSEYNPVIVFKNIIYQESRGKDIIPFTASDGKEYLINRIDPNENHLLLRCQCKDFHWRFQHFDYADKSLQGNNRKKYEGNGSANPQKLPGMCKHLIKLLNVLEESKLIKN